MYQNFLSSPWSTVKETTPQETFGLGEMPPQIFIRWEVITELRQEIAGLRQEIVEIRQETQKLEEKLEQKAGQIIPINFFETAKLKLKKSFNVVLEYYPEDNLYIIDCLELNIYGEGRDEYEALNDFNLALEESYFSLKKDKDRLVSRLQEEWKNLQAIIEEK